MKPNNAIEVHNITKKFKVYLDRGNTLKELTLFKSRRKYESREVLKGISFDVKKGEAIGLIGENGCGKSTTLKLLTRIMYPDSGTIEMNGRVSSLIELGAGFHPDMSGRQNIYTNASIFGLGRKEIESRINDIIAFSELQEFIDNPVRTYSSGMYMRLAFAVAINVDADILLIDEILAVGDANFQAKCFNRLRDIKAAGTTIVIVSHSMGQIEQICDRAIWIKEGEIEANEAPRNVIQTYMSWIMGGRTDTFLLRQDEKREEKIEKKSSKDSDYEYTEDEILELKKNGKCVEIGSREIEIVDYEVLDANTEKRKGRFSIGESIRCRIYYKRKNVELKETMCSLAIYRSDGLNCYSTNCFINTGENVVLEEEGVIEFVLRDCPFMQGEYSFDLSLNKDYGPTYHGIINACSIEIYNVATDYGVCRPHIEWMINRELENQSSLFNGKVNEKNYREKLGIEKVLAITEDVMENAIVLSEEYDMIVISQSISDEGRRTQAIIEALNWARYILVENSIKYDFDNSIKNCCIFKHNGCQDILIPISTKNKAVIIETIRNDEQKLMVQEWLLECFRKKMFFFQVTEKSRSDAGNQDVKITINLINKTTSIIRLLDESVAFGSKVTMRDETEIESRVPIRERVYPGNNYYEIIMNAEYAEYAKITVVKEHEYWLDNILPEFVSTLIL